MFRWRRKLDDKTKEINLSRKFLFKITFFLYSMLFLILCVQHFKSCKIIAILREHFFSTPRNMRSKLTTIPMIYLRSYSYAWEIFIFRYVSQSPKYTWLRACHEFDMWMMVIRCWLQRVWACDFWKLNVSWEI